MSDAASHVSDADSQATIALTERPIHYTTWCAEDHLACPCGMHQLYRNEITLPENIIIAMQHHANGPYHAPFETRGGECSGCMIVMETWHRWSYGVDCECEFCVERERDDAQTDDSRASDNSEEWLVIQEGKETMLI